MRRLAIWMTVLTFLAATALAGFGKALPESPADGWGRMPSDLGIQDKGGLFSRNPMAMKRISDQLRKLEADHGFRVLLMIEPVLIGTTAPELAAHLQQSWLPNGDGLVVVYESDSRSLGFGRDIGGEPAAETTIDRIPTHETAAILTRAREVTDMDLAPDVYVESLIGNLVREFDRYFELRKAPRPIGGSLRIGLLAIGGLTLLVLGAIAVGTLVKLPSIAGRRSFRFPEVDRPERLGAPCGGGNVTVRRFRAK